MSHLICGFYKIQKLPSLTLSRCLVCALLFHGAAISRGQTFGEALNAPDLAWTTGGDLPWSVRTNVTHDGVAAAQSGPVTNGQISWIATTVNGPGTLTFWWQLPDQGQVRLRLLVDGVTQNGIVGSGWRLQTNYIGEGTHTVEWVFTNAIASPSSYNAGRLDEVAFTATSTAPLITSQPQALSQAPGLDSVFTVSATGTPPLSYQWRRDGLDIPGAESSTLTITNTSASNAATYSVMVTNTAGIVVSTDALLSLVCVAEWGGANDVPPGLTNVLAIAAGSGGHKLVLLPEGTVVGWGYGTFGQATVPAGLSNIVAIAAGEFHSLALTGEGTVVAWGRDDYGQTDVPADLINVVAIAAYSGQSAALMSSGSIRMWGGPNYHGELNVPSGLTNAVAIGLGLSHSLALRSDGTLVAWGDSHYGVTTIPASATNIVSISAGFTHNLAVRADGAVIAWGDNYSGEANVPATLTNVAAVAAGVFASFAVLTDGTVVPWGGTFATAPRGLTNVTALAASEFHNLALVLGAPVLRAALSQPELNSNVFTVSLPSRSGKVYAMEYADSLSASAWTLLPLVAGNGRAITLADIATSAQQRFYRVREW